MSAPSTSSRRSRLVQLSLAALAAAAIAACGGGGGVGAGGTGSTFASGNVTGFGSIVVNGVHYDLSTGTDVRGDDDTAGPTDDSNRGIKIGMEVEIESGAITCADSSGDTVCRANATAVSWGTELKGPVSAVTLATGAATGNTLTVLGQKVILTSATLFASQVGAVSTKDAIAAGHLVEVHGRVNKTTGDITATLIEVKTSLDNYRLTGALDSLNTTARTATVAGQTVEFKSGVSLTGFADGQRVRVRIDPAATPTTVGNWVVERIRAAGSDLRSHAGREAEVKGVVTDLPAIINGSTTSVIFSVDGKSVRVVKADVSTAVWNVVAGLSNSSVVEVEGGIDATGVLVARKVELDNDSLLEVELIGPLAAVDTTAKTLTIGGLNGKTFDFSAGNIQYKNGGTTTTLTANQLIALSGFGVGVRAEAKGTVQADGTIKLTRFKFERGG